jgi:hypothetical protein
MANLWLIVVVGGPILLGLALVWGKYQGGRRARRADPNTPADDPAKGMGPTA